MIVDFDNIKETVIRNFYGGEKQLCAKMYVDDKNKILRGRLVPGASIGEHTHETGSEVIFILSGSGKPLRTALKSAFPPECVITAKRPYPPMAYQ